MILTLKMLILGIVFITSGGAVFGRIFRNNLVLEFLAGIVASTAFIFLLLDIIDERVESRSPPTPAISQPKFVEPKSNPKPEPISPIAEYSPGQVFQHPLKDGSLGLKMVVIPKGSFRMGDIQGSGYESEKPVHRVTIDYEFAMGKYEVTKGEFAQFVKVTGYQTEAEKGDGCYGWTGNGWGKKVGFNWRNVGFSNENNHPVVCVSWNDAKAYAQWLSDQTGYEYRLPSEAEWEYAARAGTETKYWWGNEASHKYMNYSGDSYGGLAKGQDKWKYTAPVGSFPANPFGLHDMNGNVWEWNEDSWHSNYKGAPSDGSARKDHKENVSLLRGGSWYYKANYCRSAFRNWYYQVSRYDSYGVRLVVLVS